MKVSIITINFNGYKDTCELIDSLYANETYPFEIIVVDNNSNENDGEKLEAKYPKVKVICSGENLGFAGGNNLGLKEATGEYILFINNDIIIKEPFIQNLVNRLNSDPHIGIISPKIKYFYAPDTIQYAGFTEPSTITMCIKLVGLNQKDVGQFDTPNITGSAHGACMFTSKAIIDTVGPMSEIYFLFYEEHDWSIQMRKHGYKAYYEPASCVYHKESMTIKRGSPTRTYYLSRARVIFARKNCIGISKLLACSYILLLSLPANTISILRKENFIVYKAFFKGMLDGFTKKILL